MGNQPENEQLNNNTSESHKGAVETIQKPGIICQPNYGKGDFLGKNEIILGKYNINVNQNQKIQIGEEEYTSRDIVELTVEEVERIRGELTRLIPTKEALIRLTKLRQLSPLSAFLKKQDLFGSQLSLPFGIGEMKPVTKLDVFEDYIKLLDKLKEKFQLAPSLEADKLPAVQNELRAIADKINIEIYRLDSVFLRFLYRFMTPGRLINSMILKIGHKKLQEEAKIHLEAVKEIAEELSDLPSEVGILSDEATVIIEVMYEIEKRRIDVEELVNLDRRKRNQTIATVICYLLAIIALMAFLVFNADMTLQGEQPPLRDLKLPLFGIPWPVVLWSFLGSFAAMIYRFNRRPIYDFGNAVKWMITRPFQGVVLGAAFYLVLVSGLFLLTGSNPASSSNSVQSDELILVLSFLVGFSDKFGDTVFNALVDRYSANAEDSLDSHNSCEGKEKKEEKEKEKK